MKEYVEKYKQIFKYPSLGMLQNEISKLLSEYFTKKMTPFHSFDDVIKQVTLSDFSSEIFILSNLINQ